MGDNKVDLKEIDSFQKLVTILETTPKDPKPKIKIYINTESVNKSLDGTIYSFLKIDTKTNTLILANLAISKHKIIRINIENPIDNSLDIISLELLDSIGESSQNIILDEEVEFNIVDETQEISEFDREYEYDKIRDSIVNQLNDFYNSRVNIDNLYNTATSIIDLVEKYKVFDENELKKSAFLHKDDYRPLLNRLLENRFNGTNIYPLVYDQKKFYDSGISNIDETTDDTEVFPDYKFLDFKSELNKQITINNKFLATNYRNKGKSLEFLKSRNVIGQARKSSILNPSDFMSMIEVLDRLYNGGSYKSSEDPEITISTDSVLRPYINDNTYNEMTNYSLEIDRDMLVYRAIPDDTTIEDKPTKYNIRNPEKRSEYSTKTEYELRLAQGPIHILEDQYDETFISDSRGKFNRTLTCNGTNKTGDNFYIGNDKKSILNKNISNYPKKTKVVNGEKLNLVGFIIKPIDDIENNIINGDEIVNDNQKLYPQINNTGLSIGDIEIHSKKCDYVEIDNYKDFSWNKYDKNKTYVVYFDKLTKNNINNNEYKTILEHILPGINNIMDIEKNRLKQCSNIIQVARILNKYNIDLSNINKHNFRGIIESMRNRVDKLNLYDNWITNRYIAEKNNLNIYNKIYKAILKIIYTTQNYDDNKLPDTIYKNTLRKTIIEKVKQYLKQYKLAEIDDFSKNYLDIYNPSQSNIDQLAEKIIDIILSNQKLSYYTSEFVKYNIDIGKIVDEEYIELLNDFKGIYSIDVPENKRFNFKNIDPESLSEIGLVSTLKKSKNNGQDIIDIINLTNLKKLKKYSEILIDKFGKGKYFKATGHTDWEQLTTLEKEKYIPNKTEVNELNNLKNDILKKYNSEREKYQYYVQKCGNIRITKIYKNEQDILRDSNVEIFYDSEFDTTQDDLNMYNDLVKKSENPVTDNEVITHLKIRYIYDDNDEINNKHDNIKENITNNIGKRKIKNGDIALLLTNNGKSVYRRHGSVWILITEELLSKISKCYQNDSKFLTMTLEELDNYCSEIDDSDIPSQAEKLEDAECIDLDDEKSNTGFTQKIPDKLYKLIKYYKIVLNKIDDIGYVLKFVTDIDDVMLNTITNLKMKSYRYKEIEKIKKNKVNKIDKKPDIQKYEKVYPPIALQETLNQIKQIDDFDLMMEQLDDFIRKNGMDHTKNPKIININLAEGLSYTSKNYYYNIDRITEPLICKHYTKLITARFQDNNTKSQIFNKVIDQWGKEDGEHFYCVNCGEIIGHVKYSDWEGFGKNDKAIMVREVIEEEDQSINELIQDELSIVRQVINTMSLLCKIKLTNDDYLLITNIFKNLQNTPEYTNLNFADFYYTILKKDNKLGNVVNSELVKMETEYNNDITIDNISKYSNKISYPTNKRKETVLKQVFGIRIQAIYKGYVSYIRLRLLMSIFIEIFRTGIPDYPSCSTGAERLSKQKSEASTVISDFYYNEEYAIRFFIDKIYTQIKNINIKDKKTSQELATIKIYLEDIYGKDNIKDIFSNDIKVQVNQIKNHSVINEREELKKEYKILQNLETKKIDNEYRWNNFVPSLDFVTEYEYTTPNIDYIISELRKLNSNISKLDLSIKDEYTEEKNNQKQDLLSRYNTYNNQLNDVAYKLSFSLITKINKINYTTEQSSDVYLKRWQSYTSSLGYDYISKDYFNFYIKKDSSIKSDLDNLQKIYNANIGNINNNNTSFVLIKNTRLHSNLQKFMKFDPDLYKTQAEIKRVLIKKLKMINYIYILDGSNPGKKRIFKNINDLDYKKLLELYIDNQDITDSELETLLYDKLNTDNLPKDIIDFKSKLIRQYNGNAEIDLVNMEFKDDISDNIDKIVSGKTENEINKIITDFETQSSINIYLNKFGLRDEIVEIENSVLEKNKITSFIENYMQIFQTDGDTVEYSEIVDRLVELKDSNNIQIMQFIKNKIIGSNVEIYATKVSENIKKYKSSLSIDTIQSVLYDICDINGVTQEIQNQTDKLINIEYSNSNQNEIKFRENILKENKESNIIHIQLSVLRYIILIINQLYNGITNEFRPEVYRSTKNVKKILPKDNYTNVLEINIETENLLRDTITSLMGDEIEIIESDKFVHINKFIDTITFYNDNYATNNDILKKYISNPFLMKPIVNTILVYLLSNLIDTTNDSISDKLGPLMIHIYDYIVDTCKVNSILNKDIEEGIKKKRANENIKRKSRFDKLDDEQKDVQRLMRRMNLGNIYEWDDGKNPEEQSEELLTIGIDNEEQEADQVDDDIGQPQVEDGPIVVNMGVENYDVEYGNDGNDDNDDE